MEAWRAPQGAVDALLAARHGDPFAVLGPHATPGGVAIRAFVPHAEALFAVLPDGTALPLPRRQDALFEGLVPGAALPLPYTLRAVNAGGAWELHDPYRFGPTLGAMDDHLLVEGTHKRLHERLGAHLCVQDGVAGARFAVWAPNAARVSLVGQFNDWDGRVHPMRKRVDSGIWEIFAPGVAAGMAYKFEILAADGTVQPLKADPFGRAAELRPSTASVVAADAPFRWTDQAWMEGRAARQARGAPVSIYELHAPSWRMHPDGRMYNWDELAAALIPYVRDLGFTHVELMPVMEHPLDASWGYQPIGLHAPTARMGEPDGLKRFIDACHAAEIGVILDWVPAHFPVDVHGLRRFDGQTLYEHPDPLRGFHAGWGTATFDFGRTEVAAFLASNALYWLRDFHADGLRVDAVSTMVHLDHGRLPGEWTPNADGSTDNREAIAFLRQVNTLVDQEAPGAIMMAEEATSFPKVSRPVAEGGLGFRYKWNMGWMNDVLRYVALDPLARRWHHNLVTFGLVYAFNEDFVLPLSHDEVVHGKGTLLGRLPKGASIDDWERFATLRTLYGFMWGHPGKKLLFMGGEIAQWREWSEDRELDWWLLRYPAHRGVQDLVRDLNALYRATPALQARDAEWEGFRWIDADDAERSVFTWLRFGGPDDPPVAVCVNFTPIPRPAYRLGLPCSGNWTEVLNSDALCYGGTGAGNLGGVVATDTPSHGLPASAEVHLPPLSVVFLVAGEWGKKDRENDTHAEQEQ
jgi:1,4-alpha-glucan branching enzyme